MTHPFQIMIVDDEPNMLKVLSSLLMREGYEVLDALEGKSALSLMEENHIDVLLADLRMPGMDGMTLMRKALTLRPDLPVIILTAHGTIDIAVEALKKGAFDFITKPFEWRELKQVISKAVQTARLSRKDLGLEVAAAPQAEGERPMITLKGLQIIGSSQPMCQIYEVIHRVADTPSTVLITGESGTGKELIARAIHNKSKWSSKPFIKVNCAAIPRELLESELFGYEKGAFTGAVTSKPGRFELAHEGTLFLDEIGEISLEMQVKLLRVVQDREFERVGGLKTVKVDTRLITATNIDIRKAVETGAFRDDLYYRLNVVNIHLPPLRARQDDTLPLAQYFLKRFNKKFEKNVTGISGEAEKLLTSYPWPGNIRELENFMERAVLFDNNAIIEGDDLPEEIQIPPSICGEDGALSKDVQVHGLKEAVRAETSKIEKEYIMKALEQTKENVTRAARLLQISRKSLQIKMKELGIREEMQKAGGGGQTGNGSTGG
ncbi:MAG: sigma-54 dependent transcriptional regulator [Pseudomonadota bacterium]